MTTYRKVAQLVERVAHTHDVAGSSPALATQIRNPVLLASLWLGLFAVGLPLRLFYSRLLCSQQVRHPAPAGWHFFRSVSA